MWDISSKFVLYITLSFKVYCITVLGLCTLYFDIFKGLACGT